MAYLQSLSLRNKAPHFWLSGGLQASWACPSDVTFTGEMGWIQIRASLAPFCISIMPPILTPAPELGSLGGCADPACLPLSSYAPPLGQQEGTPYSAHDSKSLNRE